MVSCGSDRLENTDSHQSTEAQQTPKKEGEKKQVSDQYYKAVILSFVKEFPNIIEGKEVSSGDILLFEILDEDVLNKISEIADLDLHIIRINPGSFQQYNHEGKGESWLIHIDRIPFFEEKLDASSMFFEASIYPKGGHTRSHSESYAIIASHKDGIFRSRFEGVHSVAFRE